VVVSCSLSYVFFSVQPDAEHPEFGSSSSPSAIAAAVAAPLPPAAAASPLRPSGPPPTSVVQNMQTGLLSDDGQRKQSLWEMDHDQLKNLGTVDSITEQTIKIRI
jgi:hypothetical protein